MVKVINFLCKVIRTTLRWSKCDLQTRHQSMPHGDYKFIMVYQGHRTKFCMLRPLTCKRAAAVAFQLIMFLKCALLHDYLFVVCNGFRQSFQMMSFVIYLLIPSSSIAYVNVLLDFHINLILYIVIYA